MEPFRFKMMVTITDWKQNKFSRTTSTNGKLGKIGEMLKKS